MTATTHTEKEIILRLFKEFYIDYNPSSIAKVLDKTRVGTYKALNSLEKDSIVDGKNFGKARFYTLNLDDDYARKNVEILLMEEAKRHQRWKDEFQNVFALADIAIIFGSIIRNERQANDIDLLLVFDKKNNDKINKLINEKNMIMTKKIHLIKQTETDMISNIKIKDNVILNAIKTGVVLHGYEKLVGLIRHVSSKK